MPNAVAPEVRYAELARCLKGHGREKQKQGSLASWCAAHSQPRSYWRVSRCWNWTDCAERIVDLCLNGCLISRLFLCHNNLFFADNVDH